MDLPKFLIGGFRINPIGFVAVDYEAGSLPVARRILLSRHVVVLCARLFLRPATLGVAVNGNIG